MRTRFRAPALALASVALLAATTAPASAEEVDDLYAGANAVTATLSILGNPLGSFAGTRAVAEQTPLVDVGSFGFQGMRGAGVGLTSAVVDAVGDVVRDPAGEGSDCGIPDLAALPIADLISALDVCSASEAALPSLTAPAALGSAEAGAIAVNGQALADVIFGLLLEPITANLGGVVTQVQGALAPVEDALSGICDELPQELSPVGLAEQANQIGLPIDDVIRALPDGEQIYESLQSDCLLSLDALVDIVVAVPAITGDLVRDALLAALDRDLLTLTLGASSSSISDEGPLTVARSQLQAFEVSSLSLQFLLDAVEDLVATQVQGVLDQVLAALPAELGAVTGQLPTLGDILGPVLDQLDAAGLVDDAPLLQVSVADSLADARSVAGSPEVDTSASRAGGVAVRISPAIASLLGIPAEHSIAPGQRVVIAEGTPLESVFSVGAVESITETLGASKVRTAGARVSATEARLLTGLQGGIVASTGVTEARVGGTLAAAPAAPAAPAGPAAPGSPSLPRTGSSDGPALLLGMGAMALLAGVLHLRRRVDAGAD